MNNTSGKDGKADNETPRDDGTRSLFLGTLSLMKEDALTLGAVAFLMMVLRLMVI